MDGPSRMDSGGSGGFGIWDFGSVGGSGRVWQALGGFGRLWEGLGGSGRVWNRLERFGKVWEDLR